MKQAEKVQVFLKIHITHNVIKRWKARVYGGGSRVKPAWPRRALAGGGPGRLRETERAGW
jgi:hypothetical protein